MLRYTYIASDNTATNGTALGTDNTDIIVHRIIFGNPGDGQYATVYDKANPVAGATTSVAAKVTQPTAAAGKDYARSVELGIRLGEGGNVETDASDVTVVWELA